jgi:hypothetical protein
MIYYNFTAGDELLYAALIPERSDGMSCHRYSDFLDPESIPIPETQMAFLAKSTLRKLPREHTQFAVRTDLYGQSLSREASYTASACQTPQYYVRNHSPVE